MLLSAVIPVTACGHISALTKVEMHVNHANQAKGESYESPMLNCIINTAGDDVANKLRSNGVMIKSRIGKIIVAQLPVSKVSTVALLRGVRSISVSTPLELCNDSARYYSNVDPVHAGTGLLTGFSGRDVIIGIIDTGIDFNHINFKDVNGKSRVKRVYMPQDTTGVSPVIKGDTLPGSHYITPEQISRLTTDTPKATHGTHTTGTAAGSYTGNGLQGVAPGADLVLCAMPVLYDADVACSINYILNYAQSVGKPVVISMSFASHEGAHDGTSTLCRLFDSLAAPGKVFVIAAGNNARERIYLQRTFNSSSDTLCTYIDNYSSSTTYKGYVSAWSETHSRHYIGLSVIDKTTHSEVASIPMLSVTDSVTSLVLDSIEAFKPYMSGEVLYASAIEDNDRFHSIVQMKVNATQANRYRLGVKFLSEEPQLFRAWSSGIIMINDVKVPGYTSAVRSSCINDLATGNEAISVGAYCTKKRYPSVSEGEVESSRITPPDIAYFSSYGPDARGISRPDICAPGAVLVSSGSRYKDNWSSSLSSFVTVDGVDYPYYGDAGTSMSTPYVAGSLALWLEYSPYLSSSDIRNVMAATALRDNYVLSGDAERWGLGKIDVMSGMQYVIENFPPRIYCDVNGDGMVDVEDVNLLINMILGGSFELRCDITGDHLVDIEDVNAVINEILQ